MAGRVKTYVDEAGDDDPAGEGIGTTAKTAPTSPAEPFDVYTENIQPLRGGRKQQPLLQGLGLIADNPARRKLIEDRKSQFDSDLQAAGDDLDRKFDLWVDYIGWLEQHVPSGATGWGLSAALEQCIELYYDQNRFKQDERLLGVFMKFSLFCQDPIEIFSFMYANSIASLLARFYIEWSRQYEARRNVKRALDLIRLGLQNLASPRQQLEEAKTQLRYRIQRLAQAGELDNMNHNDSTGLLSHAARAQHQLQGAGIRAALNTLRTRPGADGQAPGRLPVQRAGLGAVSAHHTGLRSQQRAGARQQPASAAARRPRPNAQVQVLAENDGQREPEPQEASSQPIRGLGKRGPENQVASCGRLSPSLLH